MYKNERGFTLAEALVSVALMGVIILSASSLEDAARRTERQVDWATGDTLVSNIVSMIATDIHRAENVSGAEGSRLILVVDGAKVEWRTEHGRIVRARGKIRQMWPFHSQIVFALETPRIIRLQLPQQRIYSFYSVRGGTE